MTVEVGQVWIMVVVTNLTDMKISFWLFGILLIDGFNLNQSKPFLIKGDLTFQKVSFMSLYGATDSVYQSFLNEIDNTLLLGDNSENQEYELYSHFDKLRDNGLLRSPYVFLRDGSDSTIVIYLSKIEYDKIKDYKHSDLIEDHKKVVISFEVKQLDDHIYYSDKIVDLKKVSGQTYPNLRPIKKLF